MEYKHDVFISYRRDPYQDEWLVHHFLPIFRALVWQEIAAACKRPTIGIFFDQTELSDETRKFDQQGIEPGENWRTSLKEALCYSRCLLALWSPMYFYSEWCLIEWQTFANRGVSAKRNLVVPVTVHDGEAFPDPARASQVADLREFVIIGEGFKRTERYVDFQDRLRQLAARVAKVVCEAPAISAWPIAEPRAVPDEPAILMPRL